MNSTSDAAALSFSTGLAGAQPRIPNPDTLFYGVYWEPVNLDPHAITDFGSMWMLDNAHETLVRHKTKDLRFHMAHVFPEPRSRDRFQEFIKDATARAPQRPLARARTATRSQLLRPGSWKG